MLSFLERLNSKKKSKERMKEELLLHLHEQYAINNNSYFSSIVVFIVALLAAFGAYGYVFLHSSPNYNYSQFISNDVFCIDAVVIAAIALLFVIGVINRICIYQGVKQRTEQFIIYKIRKDYGLLPGEGTLPEKYHPFDKEKSNNHKHNKINIIQGLYGELVFILNKCVVFIVVSLIFKFFQNLIHCDFMHFYYQAIYIWILFIIALFVYIFFLKKIFNNMYEDYQKYLFEYKEERPLQIKNEYVYESLSFSDAFKLFVLP